MIDLKIGVITTAPLITSCAVDPTCTRRGIAIDAAIIACSFLKLNCTFVPYENLDYGDANQNGTGTGLIGAIQRGAYDLSPPMVMPTYSRYKAAAFSDLYVYMDLVLTTRTPSADPSLNWSFLYTFQWPVWLTILLIVCLISLYLTMEDRAAIEKMKEGNLQSLLRILVKNGAAVVTKNRDSTLLQRDSIRTLFAFWELTIVILASAYTSVLFTQKVLANNAVPFVDLESFITCVEQRRCRLVMSSLQTSPYLLLTASGNKLSTRINDALLVNRPLIIPDAQIPETILQETSVYLVWLWPEESILYNPRVSACDFYMIESSFKHIGGFAMRKESPLREPLSRVGLILQESGIAEALRRRYVQTVNCPNKRMLDDAGRGLASYRAIFYLYLCGICASAGLLLIERVAMMQR